MFKLTHLIFCTMGIRAWKYGDESSLVDMFLCDSDSDYGDVDGGLVLESMAHHQRFLLLGPLWQTPQDRVDLTVGGANRRRQGTDRSGHLKEKRMIESISPKLK